MCLIILSFLKFFRFVEIDDPLSKIRDSIQEIKPDYDLETFEYEQGGNFTCTTTQFTSRYSKT